MALDHIDDHSHCETCFRTKCREGCPIVACDELCGARFHWCKKEEHTLCCTNLKVPCINHHYGCPCEMPRKQLGSHLSTCPASVICCTCEWNRWPIYAKERNDVVPIKRTNFHAKDGQLDVALALRDQKLLIDAMKAPRKVRQSLKSPLNHRFPAVPLIFPHSYAGDLQPGAVVLVDRSEQIDLEYEDQELVSSDDNCSCDCADVSHKFNVGSGIPRTDVKTVSTGRTDIFINKLESTETNIRNNNIIDYDEDQEAKCQKIIADEHKLSNSNCDKETCNHAADVIAAPPVAPSSLPLQQMISLDLTLESITRYHAKPRSMYTFMCSQVFRRDEYTWHVRNIHSEIYAGLNGWLEQRCPLACYGCDYSVRRMYPNTKGSSVVYSPILESFGVKPQSHVPELKQNIAKETDTFGTVTKVTVTNDNKNKDEDRHDPTCMILPSISPAEKNIRPTRNFTELPVEILEHIAQYLDGFSLNNLSLASNLLRNVCYNILKEKGIVIQQWIKNSEEKSWYTTEPLWLFPNSVTPIKTWGLEGDFSMADHLRTCMFNIKLTRTQPFKVMLPDDVVMVKENH